MWSCFDVNCLKRNYFGVCTISLILHQCDLVISSLRAVLIWFADQLIPYFPYHVCTQISVWNSHSKSDILSIRYNSHLSCRSGTTPLSHELKTIADTLSFGQCGPIECHPLSCQSYHHMVSFIDYCRSTGIPYIVEYPLIGFPTIFVIGSQLNQYGSFMSGFPHVISNDIQTACGRGSSYYAIYCRSIINTHFVHRLWRASINLI